MTQYCQQIPLVLNHDWATTIAAMRKLEAINEASERKSFKSVTTRSLGYQEDHKLGAYGMISRHNTNPEWLMGRSGIVDKTMPWLTELLDALKEANPTGCWVGSMRGNVDKHKDNFKDQCALNYIIECEDSTAHTWIDDGNIREEYPSIPHTAWLINAQVPHGISNVGQRFTFSIRFDKPYEDVKTWLLANSNNLTFGNKEIKQ
jgi:hypothetical protein